MSVVQSVAVDVLENQTVFARMGRRMRGAAIGGRCSRSAAAASAATFSCRVIVHHADRRGAATGEAFDKLDAVFAIGADRDGIVHAGAVVMLADRCRAAGQSFSIS